MQGPRRIHPKSVMRARVEMLCANKGWGLADLAREMGVTRQWVDHLLKFDDPRTSQMERMARALGVDISELRKAVDPTEYGRALLSLGGIDATT